MTDHFEDLFATGLDTNAEAKSVLRGLFSQFNRKQKKSLSVIREIEDFSLRCERVRKFFAEAIGGNILSLTVDGGSYSFRYSSSGLGCISSEWTEWLSYSEVAVALATANLTVGTKSRSASSAKEEESPVVPEFDFSEFFDDWGSFTPSTETPFPQAIAEEPIEVKEDNSRIGNFYTEASDLYIPKSREDKIEKNLAAIRCLKNIEGGSEELTVDAQKTLACYTGWGGAAGVFDENYADFSAQRDELKQLLTSEEYESARQSTLSSFYTEPWMINIIYEALQRFGFHGGTILEPAMGVGNFFRFLPKELRGSRLYGVELDSVTGRIAGLLYPDAKITLGGFETADYQCPNSYFDVCVGNIPFGSFKVWDTEFGSKWLIHDFFFAKGLSKVRPGGLLAFITSKGSMDKADDSLRRYMASHATFLGAIRFPSNAFVGYGGADVTTDILFFKKQASETSTQPFIDAVPMVNPEDGTILDDLVVNEYYVAHPEQMLGVMKTETGRFGSSVTTTCSFDGTREELLSLAEQAAERIEGSYEECEDALAEDGEEVKRVMYDPEMGVRNYTFTFLEGELFYREDNFLYSRKVNSTAEKRILWCCKVRDVLRNLLQMQADGCSDAQFEAGARELNRIYDSAVAKIGYLSNRANTLAFRDDADYPLLCSLENIDPADEDNVTKSEIFTKRSVRPNLVLMPVESAEDAIRCSIAESGKLDPGVLRSIYNPYGEDVKGAAYMDKLAEEVGDMLYRDPENNGFWVLADEYLSGNVRKKLLVATEAALAEPDKYTRNVTALRNVLPLDVPISDISLGIGTPWITCEDYTKFMHEVLLDSVYARRRVSVLYSKELASYEILGMDEARYCRACSRFGYGTANKNAADIMKDALNGKPIAVYTKDADGKSVIDTEETMLARQKLDELNEAFHKWLLSDAERVRFYEDYYNLYYNGVVLRRYDGSSLTFPGINPSIQLRNYQRDAVARSLSKNLLLAHAVGAGKTYTMAASCAEKRRLNLCKKPLFVVPKSLLLQTASEFLRLYPSANIIVASDRDFEKKRRRRFVARIATSSSFDACIMTHDQFAKIPVSKELREARIQKELDNLETVLLEEHKTRYNWDRRNFVKRLERLKANLTASLLELQTKSEDDFLCFELLGIDALYVDEAHLFKNLRFATSLSCAGVGGAASKRSDDMKVKVDYLNEKTNYRAVVFATGTPVANSLSELYIMTSFLRGDLLEERGIEAFDRWAANFAQVKCELELSVANQWQLKDRLSSFKNLPELTQMFHEFSDVVVSEDLPIERPKLHGGANIVVECHMDDFAKELNDEFLARAERIHGGHVRPDEDNFLKIANDARKLACDNRLMQVPDEEGELILPPFNPDGKIAHLIDNVVLEYHRFDSVNFPATQIVFCDMGTPDGNQFNLYADIKLRLIEAGIPADEIRFVHDAKTDAQRIALFKQVDAAKVRVLIGSSSKCGLGCNVQTYLSACHILCAPWRPADLEQEVGRIVRYGNRTPGGEVFVYQYVQTNGFDAFNWSVLQRKSQFITSVMLNKNLDRTCEDVSEVTYNYGLIKMIATGDSTVKERMEAEVEVQRLKLLKTQWERTRHDLLRDYQVNLPEQIRQLKAKISDMEADLESAKPLADSSKWVLVVDDETSCNGVEDIGVYLAKKIDELPFRDLTGEFLGRIGNFTVMANRSVLPESGHCVSQMVVSGEYNYTADLMRRADAITSRIDTIFKSIPDKLERSRSELAMAEEAIAKAKRQYDAPFEYESQLAAAKARLDELTAAMMGGQHTI